MQIVKAIYLCSMKNLFTLFVSLALFVLISCKPSADQYIEEAKKALDEQKFELAQQKSTDAINADPDNAIAFNLRGIAYLNQKKAEDAIVEFEKSIQLDSSNYKAYYNLGLAYIESKDYKQAIVAFSNAMGLNSNESDLYNNLGIAYFELDQKDSAFASFNKAIELNPRFELAFLNRAKINRASANWQAAIDDYTHSLKVNPDNIQSIFGIAISYFEIGKKDEGCKWLNRAKKKGHLDAENELQARCQ